MTDVLLRKAILALQHIAAGGNTPCRTCDAVHEARPNGEFVTWKDPVDGHPYFPMSPAEYASKILQEGKS